MTTEEISNIHLQTINSSWDYYIDTLHSIEDIDIEKVRGFIHKYEKKHKTSVDYNPIEFLELKSILRDNKLTFGAYLLFSTNGSIASDIQIGRFKSEITIIDTLSINDDLFTQQDKILAFIKKHLMVELIITEEPQHTERYDYPLDAIREIVSNMIVHRDYRSSNGSIIKIFDDRIEFYNPGGLYGDLTLDKLLNFKYSSQTRNKLIADAFKDIGIIEKYGSGIKRVFSICQNYGIISPTITTEDNSFELVLYKKKINVPLNVPLNVPINERQKNIISEIKENRQITQNELAAKNSVNRETIKRDLQSLQEKNIIKRIGSRKTGHWEVLI